MYWNPIMTKASTFKTTFIPNGGALYKVKDIQKRHLASALITGFTRWQPHVRQYIIPTTTTNPTPSPPQAPQFYLFYLIFHSSDSSVQIRQDFWNTTDHTGTEIR